MRHACSDTYDEIPYEELPIHEIEWTEEAVRHVRNRSGRKGSPTEIDIEPVWATEAALDPNRLVGDSGSQTGKTVSVIGRSGTCGRVLEVILLPQDHPPRGRWWGVTAHVAYRSDRAKYEDETR